jgi:hypothetical protein
LSLLSTEEFNHVQRALQALTEPAAPPLAEDAASQPQVLQVATLRVRYSLEPARNTVILLGVSREPAEGDSSP